MSRLPKSHLDYWKKRIRKRVYRSRAGEKRIVPEWQIRFHFRGKVIWFQLHTTDRDKAARKAREVSHYLMEHGAESAIAKFKHPMIVSKTDPTVGDFLAEVRSKVGLKERTFNTYAKKFRTLSAGVMLVKTDASKLDTFNDGYQNWVDRVESIKLSRLTACRI